MKRSKDRNALLIFLIPAVALYMLVYLYPTLRTAMMSFFAMDSVTAGIDKWTFVGISNYIDLMHSRIFIRSLINIAKIWAIGGIITLVTALLFAVILTSGVKFKRFFRSIIYLPNVISAVALGTMWLQYVYNSKYGLLKNFFTSLGMDRLASFQWTASENQFIAMLVAYCFGMVGYFMLTLMAGIERISPEYYEAATIEGANAFVKFRRITFPLLQGVIKTTFVLWSVRAVGFFVWSQIFSPLIPDTETITPMVYMYQAVFGTEMSTSSNPGAGAAVGVIMTVIVVLIFAGSNLIFKDQVDEF